MYLWMCHHERCCLNSSVGATTMRCGNQYRLCWNLIKLSKTIHHLAFELHIAPSKIEKNFALWCNADWAVRAVKRRKAQLFFKLIQLFGQCRLRDKQALRRLGDVSVFFYLEHITENTCIHVDLRNRCLNDSISESERKIIKISGDALFLQSNKA